MRKIIISFLLLSTLHFGQTRQITLDDIFPNKVFTTTSTAGFQWVPGQPRYSFLKRNPESKKTEIWVYDIASGKEESLVSAGMLTPPGEDQPLTVMNYKWSPDGTCIMLTGLLPARAVKSGGAAYIFHPDSGKFTHVIKSEEEQSNIEFSPDGKKISFVRDNDLYVYALDTEKETRLTFDGSETILNGVFDWVYEEEFSIIRAYEWAPDSRSIAFWRLDQSNVPEISIGKYDSLYLNVLKMRYPKAGAPNSVPKIGVVDIASAKTVWMNIGDNTDIYIPRIKFTNSPATLSIQRLDRLQQKMELLFADTRNGSTKVILTDTDSAWVEVYDGSTFLKDGSFIWESERDGYKHFYLYDKTGKLLRQLTRGKWETGDLLGVDERNGQFYFYANKRGAIYTDVCRAKLTGSEPELFTATAGTHSVSFSDDYMYYTDRYSSTAQPPVSSLYSADGKKLKDLTTISNLPQEKVDLGACEFFQFPAADGTPLNAFCIKPVPFDPAKKYPVLFYNYSGPGSQSVLDRWLGGDMLWYHMLAQKGYMICMIDNRGTKGRGRDFKKIVYRQLGVYEVHDHIAAAQYLASLPYVDGSRIGIWGWSYGGYVSALTLMKAPKYFKTAVSVAPVTDWLYYDNIYTERYMSLPSLNPDGYAAASVLNQASQLSGKLLLVHGTADDNVHFQNSVKLAEKLIEENKPFRTMYYPEKDHGIYGGKTRLHLYTMMTEFLLENL